MGLLDWWKRESEIYGTVLFPGPIPVRSEHFDYLTGHGFTLQKADVELGSDLHWALKLEHKDHGTIDMICSRNFQNAKHLLDHAFMTDDGGEAIAKAGCAVNLKLRGKKGNILEDRKAALRLYSLLMTDYGLAAIDDTSFKVWSKPQLEDELSHDAALDVSDIFGVHAVHDQAGTYWLHTHGLGEIGASDFDIVNPSQSLLSQSGLDTLRAIAFAVLESELRLDESPYLLFMRPLINVCLIDINKYVRDSKHSSVSKLKDDIKESHNEKRGIICEPRKKILFWTANQSPTPCKFLTEVTGDGVMTRFTKAGTELLSKRARATYKKFGEFLEEFGELQLPALAKIAVPVDSDPESHEHMWFEVHKAFPDHVDATLLNEPNDIAKLKAGMRGDYPAENISDWTIMCPFGSITPAGLGVARVLRSRFDEARKIVEEANKDNHG